MIETVLGRISPGQLGTTLMHEHLYLGDWNARVADPQRLPVDKALEMIIPVVKDAYAAGVRTLVDVTPCNMGRDVEILKAASEHTGMNIIAATGIFIAEDPLIRMAPEEYLIRFLEREAREGVQGTDIRCGVIKCGTGEVGLTENNKKILRVCGAAQRLTGLPIITHCRPANTRYGLFQQDIFEEQGADLSRVVIGHFRAGDPLDYAENVMRRGSYIAIDQMNFNGHNLEHNLSVIPELIRRGWADRLIFSHDAVVCFNHSRWSDWDHRTYINYAPDSLSFIHRVVLPGLIEQGVDRSDLERIMIHNPARIFSRGEENEDSGPV